MRQHTLIGERGPEIPVGARIIAVCDAYDAITSDRSYASARSHDEALAELRSCAGSQFDGRGVLRRQPGRPRARARRRLID
jgi:HD-GYP domain-containing protein (c-di-GMP phosphodiesterase class II)